MRSPRGKTINGFARTMAQTRGISQGCAFWGLRQKMVTPTPISPQFQKILHYKSWVFFAKNTYKFCSKHHQNS